MKRRSIVRAASALAAAAALTLGCASTPDDAGTTTTTTGGDFDESLAEDTTILDSDRKKVPELQTVYFDFDMALVRDDQKPTIQSNASEIQNRNDWRRVTLQGYCDERGSEEYNLALGDRRAKAVKRYLVDLGVSSSRLRTVSFGEAKPAYKLPIPDMGPNHEIIHYEANRMDDEVRFTWGASKRLTGIPNAFLQTVLGGIVKQAKARGITEVDEEFVLLLNKERDGN